MFFFSELFNMCIVHRYIPNSCLNTTIVPICKNKNGNMSDTSNYRPVAVATVMSKLLGHFILSNISPFLATTDNQFSFKAGHSADQCTFLLKQTASYFVTIGSSVHAVFLDASKAFDRVLRMKLFEKLIQRKVPMCFEPLMKHWYKEQTMQINNKNNILLQTHAPYHRHKSTKGGLLCIIAHYRNRACTRPTLGGAKHFILTTAVSSCVRAQKMDNHTVAKSGKHLSELFHVSNGVRQGGVLSPYLFAVYLDDSSNELNNQSRVLYW